MDKRGLSERDICTKFITPALRDAGWDEMVQIREEVSFTAPEDWQYLQRTWRSPDTNHGQPGPDGRMEGGAIAEP